MHSPACSGSMLLAGESRNKATLACLRPSFFADHIPGGRLCRASPDGCPPCPCPPRKARKGVPRVAAQRGPRPAQGAARPGVNGEWVFSSDSSPERRGRRAAQPLGTPSPPSRRPKSAPGPGAPARASKTAPAKSRPARVLRPATVRRASMPSDAPPSRRSPASARPRRENSPARVAVHVTFEE